MVTIIKENTVRKTFNISAINAEKMARILSQRKQTEFVNRAIEREFEHMQEMEDRQQALANLAKLRKIRASMPKSAKPSEEVLRELRQGRSEHLRTDNKTHGLG
jgi:hypothetical protein